KIEVAQKRLTARMDHLPGPQWERFKAMLTLLRAQQDVLDSAEALMQRARGNVVPREIPVPIEGLANLHPPIDQQMRRKDDVRHRRRRERPQPENRRRLTLVTILAAGLVFGYMTFPGKRQDIATKPTATTTGAIGGRAGSLAVAPEPATGNVAA